MKKLLAIAGLLIALFVGVCNADEVTFTFLNFGASSFAASSTGLTFGNAINVLVTDNNNGHSMTLAAVDSGFTGSASTFTAGPPLVAIFGAAGANSVLIESGSHVFLSGAMDPENELEAEYPDRAGAFLSRFSVSFVDPAVLSGLGTSTKFAPDGSVSLTLGETSFGDGKLDATLGGGAVTIETTTVPEPSALILLILGSIMSGTYIAKRKEAV